MTEKKKSEKELIKEYIEEVRNLKSEQYGWEEANDEIKTLLNKMDSKENEVRRNERDLKRALKSSMRKYAREWSLGRHLDEIEGQKLACNRMATDLMELTLERMKIQEDIDLEEEKMVGNYRMMNDINTKLYYLYVRLENLGVKEVKI